ncbi:enterobactin synthase subunit E [Salmonella enterica subsp. enterica serovar Pullorum]|nr:enterobactin synthase subunit E [Salmonella enterica subsp. enterica serovar Pullorum]
MSGRRSVGGGCRRESTAAGEIGRLMTRGPYTFRGYFNSPLHNASAFDANGFYCSGDLISIDQDGYITVHGVKKIRSIGAARR